jgi:hypothetical protein
MAEEIYFFRMVEDIMDNFMRTNFQDLGYLSGRMGGDMKDYGKMDFNKVMEFIESSQELF